MTICRLECSVSLVQIEFRCRQLDPTVARSNGAEVADDERGRGAAVLAPRRRRRPRLAVRGVNRVRFPATMKNKEYVSQQEGAYRVAGTRVSLDSIVYAFQRGQTPESIAQSFPVLNLEQVYGAITFYLAHRAEVDAYLRENELEWERLREETRRADPAFYQKLSDARQRQS
jgi:uncharacterized protein (DUF433 family)